MQMVTARELAAEMRTGEDMLLVDVRSPGEYRTGHLPGATNVPLEQIASGTAAVSDLRPLVLVCQRGARAAQAFAQLQPRRANIRVLEGGTAEWQRCGLPIEGAVSRVWSLERQIRFTAGLLTLLGAAGSLAWRPLLALAIFIGGGLTITAAINWCGMGLVLAKMPWNQAKV